MHASPAHATRSVAIAQASTDDVPVGERLRYWEAHTASQLIGVRCSSYAAEGLCARQRNFDLGNLRIAEIAGNEHVVERTLPVMRRHPKDSIFACMLLEGEAFFYQSGLCLPVREGDLIIYGTTTPYLYGVTRQVRQVQIDIAVDRLSDTCPIASIKVPIRIDGSLRTGRLLAQALRRDMLDFVDAPWADKAPAIGQRLQSTLELLIRAHAVDRPRGGDLGALRVMRAEQFIAAHLSDPELDAEAVADHMSMSLRNLNRLFDQNDCSVSQWIWCERLALAHRMLANAQSIAMTISDVALACGFSTPSHFARAFKDKYGTTPSDHRLRAIGACGA
jgi:AraC-like DNA-binding protein